MRLDYLPCLFIHIYLSSALPTAEARIFVACAIHVWMQSRIYVKKCRQASRINLFLFLILSFPSPPQYLKVQNTPRIEIACTVSAAVTVLTPLPIYTEVGSPLPWVPASPVTFRHPAPSPELVQAHQQELPFHLHWGSVPAWPRGTPSHRLHQANRSVFEIRWRELSPCPCFSQLWAF